MSRILRRSWTALLFGSLIVASGPVMAAGRPANEILKELDAMRMPPIDQARRSDPAYVAQLQRQVSDLLTRRDALILELLQADPDHERLTKLMQEHWRRLPEKGPFEDTLDKEIADILARSHNEALRTEASFARAQLVLHKGMQAGTLDMSGVDEFVRKHPKDERSEFLVYLASTVAKEPKIKRSLEERVLAEYPKSKFADTIRGARRQAEGIGKPFEMEFADAITGSNVSTKEMKGKVIVVDFWATWCLPCVAEMPHMKALYEKYHKQGVEFIGVSLDQSKEEGGLDSLKNFVKQKEIPWPQYYQGNGWESPFSRSWGVNSIPAIFVVDAQGNLYSVQGYKKLDEMIPELLKKKAGAAPQPASRG